MSSPEEEKIEVMAETPPPPPPATAPELQRDRLYRLEDRATEPSALPPGRRQDAAAAAPPPAAAKAAPEDAEGGAEGGVAGGVVGGVEGNVEYKEEIYVQGEASRPQSQVAAGATVAAPSTRGGSSLLTEAAEDRRSTFGLDVATDAFAEMRRHLREGRLPPPESVRVEEYVNSFDYGDRPPARGDFALRAEGAPTPFAGGERSRLLRFSLRARKAESPAGARQPVARDAEVQVEFDQRAVARYRLLGYEDRGVAGERSRAGLAGAGEIVAGGGVTALYEVELQPDAAPGLPLATLRLRYHSAESGKVVEAERALTVRELAPSWERASPALRLASVVAELAEILSGSSRGRGASLDQLSRRASALAWGLAGSSEEAAAAELASLIGRAAQLAAGGPPSR